MSNNLLPLGFKDLKGAVAKQHFFSLNTLINCFLAQEYELVLPSLFEYAKIESSKDLDNCFKTTQIADNKSLIIRDDITKQIARIYESSKEITKYCYYGEICKINSTISNGSNYTQIGFEEISENNLERNKNSLFLAIDSLKKLSISNISINISLPFLLTELSKDLQEEEELKQLIEILKEKNISKIKNNQKFQYLKKFLIPKTFSNQDLSSKFNSEKLQNCLKLIELTEQSYPNIEIILDPLNYKQYSYHSDFSFSIIDKNKEKLVARGGCYDIKKDTPAIGVSFYLNELY